MRFGRRSVLGGMEKRVCVCARVSGRAYTDRRAHESCVSRINRFDRLAIYQRKKHPLKFADFCRAKPTNQSS